MADDPRIEVAERHIWRGAQAAVTNAVRPHTIGSLRRAAREALVELDAADPLRALLADEDRAASQSFSDSRLLTAAKAAIEGAPVGTEGQRLTRVFCEDVAQRAVSAVLATLRSAI